MRLKFQNASHTFFIELALKNGQVFSASGDLYKGIVHVPCSAFLVAGGQCLDVIPDFVKTMDDKKQAENLLLIHNLWLKYHLNDMCPDCEHGIHEKAAKKELTIYTYRFKGDFLKLKEKINLLSKNKILSKNIKLNKACRTALRYGWNFKAEFPPKKMSAIINKLYKVKEKENKLAGWVHYDGTLTPSGVLCKPCPECGYKYGTAWNFRPIPQNDLNKIKELLTGREICGIWM